MFTFDQIKEAHSKVKSGADFPAYIRELVQLGVTGYNTYVADGHTEYFGKGNYSIVTSPRYELLTIADKSNTPIFKNELKEHQQGKTGYPEFCKMSAETGVKKWSVDTQKMTCTYYDMYGNEIFSELIPE